MKQLYWRFVYAFTWIVIICGYIGTEDWRQRAQRTDFQIKLVSWWDFLDVLYYMVVYAIVRKLYYYLFEDSLIRRLRANDPSNFEYRLTKVAKEGWHMIFYGASCVLAYYLFAGTDYLSVYLLGNSSCDRMVNSWTEYEPTPELRLFHMVALAHHTFSTGVFLERARKVHVPEFNETLLHHMITIAMISMSYLCGFFPFGVTVLVCCDLSDFFMALCKFIRDIGFGKGTGFIEAMFGVMVCSWIYTRFYVMGFCMLSGLGKVNYMIMTDQFEFFNKPCQLFFREKYAYYYQVKVFLIFLLCLLNMWWIYLIMKIAFNRVFKDDKNFSVKEYGEKAACESAKSKTS